MAVSYYFYDLETSGVSPKRSRIMQFAGQRTDEHLEPIGEPDDIYIKLSPDILPEPDAILLTGITPQKTLAEGISEADFLKYFAAEITKPDTVFLGFNTIRFDDEFMRYLHFRNYYDPYEWQWKDGRTRWDMLDVVRMMRALRPDGLKWPVASDGSATNRLESLTSINGIVHNDAHTALSDVRALIDLSRKVKHAQPKLFEYLLGMRSKHEVRKLVMSGEPFVYTSGAYEGRYEKTTVAVAVSELEDASGALVYDCRYPIERWRESSVDELKAAFAWEKDKTAADRPPFKLLQYNRCPAVAPLPTLDSASQDRLQIDMQACLSNAKEAQSESELTARVVKVLTEYRLNAQTAIIPDDTEPDTRLYEGFVPKSDYPLMREVQLADKQTIAELTPEFHDHRLKALWPLYKARNYPKSLSPDERRTWERHIEQVLFAGETTSQYAAFLKRISDLAKSSNLTTHQEYILGELKLYADSIAPY